jgi:hypothetical protein
LLSLTLSASPATAALIDDFNTSDGLSGFTFSKILDAGGPATTGLSFSETSGALGASNSEASIEQALLLHSTGLPQGMEVQVDVALAAANERDLGLAIGATHADLGASSGDNRNTADYLFIALKNSTTLTLRGFIGGTEIELIDSNDFAAMNGADVRSLFISRTMSDGVQLGWYDSLSVRHVAEDNNGGNPAGPLTYTPANLSIFDHVGLYADVRTTSGGISGLDNLRIVVPEPASCALALIGLVGIAPLWKRRARA